MFRILSIAVLIFIAALGVSAQESDAPDLQSIVESYVPESGAAVTVQVSTADGTWSAAAGLADGERPATPEDRFRIGSMSKTFVSVVSLLLVEDGVFNLDDPARQYLPNEYVERIANADTVTIRQLLSMRSGIDDYLGTQEFWDALIADPTHEWTLAEALTYAYDLPPLFAPGEAFAYSNTNYLLMQAVIENVTGKTLADVTRERLLDPLGLEDTYTQISETLEGEFVFGYEDIDFDGDLDVANVVNDGAGLGDGALVSNVFDLTTFYRELFEQESILNDALMEELMTFIPTEEDDSSYSLGLSYWNTDEFGTAIGHSGGVVGFISLGAYLPEYDATVMVLAADYDVDIESLALEAVAAVFE